MTKDWISVKDLASIKGVTERAVRKAVNQNKYVTRMVDGTTGAKYEILVESLDYNLQNVINFEKTKNNFENKVEPSLQKITQYPTKAKQIALARYDLVNLWVDYISDNDNTQNNSTANDFNFEVTDYDLEEDLEGSQTIGKKKKIKLEDMDHKTWKQDLEADLDVLNTLIQQVDRVTPELDEKLQTLLTVIKDKIQNPINRDNKKVIIFSAFADTAEYLYKNISEYVKSNFGLETAIVTGQKNKTTIPKIPNDLNTVLTFFSPMSKHKEMIYPDKDYNIDVLIATDCISEGQNLQDCDYLVNYDIHWNPVRIIQRFGRVDRIGSKNDYIQLVNFWPDITLDEYINLKARVETRMKATIMTSTGNTSDNVLDDEEIKELLCTILHIF